MRDILFRGKRTDNGEWVYGSLIDSGNHEQVMIYPHYDGASTMGVRQLVYHSSVSVEHDTVGEWTGLTDKNNRMVFEGDVVLCDGMKSVVKFGDRNCGCCHDVYGFVFDTGTYLDCGCIAYKDSDKCYFLSGEVIGNIYDNPDLIEQ